MFGLGVGKRGGWNTVGEGAREEMREKGRKERWGLGLFRTLVHKTINPPLMEDVQVNNQSSFDGRCTNEPLNIDCFR